ncbi:MAG: hypothetical protein ACI4BA_07510 [Prevotella sp.]
MNLLVFNPEHDIALAKEQPGFTPPHAARALRHDLDFLPAFLAGKDDVVLVEDVDRARGHLRKVRARLARMGVCRNEQPQLVLPGMLSSVGKVDKVVPWGWDKTVCEHLLAMAVPLELLPAQEYLETVKELSHRVQAIRLLDSFGSFKTLPLATSLEQVEEWVAGMTQAVLKAPWSSSGRGIRFVDGALTTHQQGWVRNLLKKQGSVIVEPYYRKITDLGMEFYSDGRGGVEYLGLSLFATSNGEYTGSVLATENRKRQMLQPYVSAEVLDKTAEHIRHFVANDWGTRYEGPFGVDMMVVKSETGEAVLHPCVEINLRLTMGHVALKMSPRTDDEIRMSMTIMYENNQYQLKVRKL